MSPTQFRLIFNVPPTGLAACKAAIFAAGAGRYPGGKYTECCWTTAGTGQFRPGDAANPHIGTVGALEETPEVRVETICVGEDVARLAVEALKMYVFSLDVERGRLVTGGIGHIHMNSHPTVFSEWRISDHLHREDKLCIGAA